MNRRDIIIVAALINAGLLIVLFVSAVRTRSIEEKKAFASSHEPASSLETTITKPAKISSSSDQIDQVINEYSAKITEKEKSETKTLLPPVLIPEQKVVSKSEVTPKTLHKPYAEGLRTVTVEKGDVLERIAKNNGVSVEEIMKLNELSSSHLRIGQVLKLPAKSSTGIVKKEVVIEGKYYIVKAGDNPWTIAQKNGMQVEELLELNNMDAIKAKRLRPGDKLRIK